MKNYLLELRNRLFLIFFNWFCLLLTGYFYKEILLFILIKINLVGNEDVFLNYFVITNVTDLFSVYMTIIYSFAIQGTLWYSLYQAVSFLKEGLYRHEYLIILTYFLLGLTNYFFTVVCFHFLIFPFFFKFFFNFSNFTHTFNINFYFEAKITEYINLYFEYFYISLCFCQFISLVIFIIIFLINDIRTIQYFKKFIYLIFLSIGTVMTPPDIFSQFFVFCFFLISFEIFLFFKCLKKIF